jgi:hypothetical protein
MILPLTKGAVAEWPFENGPIQQLNWLNLENSLALLETVFSTLHDHKLLFPKVICLSQWMRAGEFNVAGSKRIDKSLINVTVNSLRPLADVFALCHSIFDNESVYPLTIEIFGSGVILTRQGDQTVDNLIRVYSTTLDIFRITVATHSDVWLPFSLEGKAQTDLYILNSDRLVNALEQIQRKTGFKVQEGNESYYSVIKGFRLENVRYADGSIADVT